MVHLVKILSPLCVSAGVRGLALVLYWPRRAGDKAMTRIRSEEKELAGETKKSKLVSSARQTGQTNMDPSVFLH